VLFLPARPSASGPDHSQQSAGLRAHSWQVDKDNVAKLLLRVVGDANGSNAALNLDPLVILHGSSESFQL